MSSSSDRNDIHHRVRIAAFTTDLGSNRLDKVLQGSHELVTGLSSGAYTTDGVATVDVWGKLTKNLVLRSSGGGGAHHSSASNSLPTCSIVLSIFQTVCVGLILQVRFKSDSSQIQVRLSVSCLHTIVLHSPITHSAILCTNAAAKET